MTKIDYRKLRPSAKIDKAYPDDSGYDISASLEKSAHIDPGRWMAVDTGIMLRLPFGVEAQIRPRSGIALKYGVTVLNAPGTIDAGYRGEIKVILINLGTKRFFINDGDKIAQICFSRIKQTELFEVVQGPGLDEEVLLEGARGNKGFGSTGI